MMSRFLTIFCLVFFLVPWAAEARNFQVEHLHLLGSCKGQLEFTEDGVKYTTDKKNHSRFWKYQDIQQLAIEPNRISILTYKTRKIKAGADQTFKFKLLTGSLNEQLREELESRVARPLVSSIVPAKMPVQFSIPVRHRLFLNDSQGFLEFGSAYIVYRSEKPKDSRIWRYDQLLSFASTGPFELRIGALQKTGGEYGEEKNYVFDLKRRLTPQEYDFIWNKINRPEIERK